MGISAVNRAINTSCLIDWYVIDVTECPFQLRGIRLQSKRPKGGTGKKFKVKRPWGHFFYLYRTLRLSVGKSKMVSYRRRLNRIKKKLRKTRYAKHSRKMLELHLAVSHKTERHTGWCNWFFGICCPIFSPTPFHVHLLIRISDVDVVHGCEWKQLFNCSHTRLCVVRLFFFPFFVRM